MDMNLHDIFVEEAEENLQNLETLIISLEENPDDDKMINEAFRAIHSLKGGAGLAGFSGIKDFSHVVEDLFENIRNGSLKIKKELISIILKSTDILTVMISNIKNNIDSNEGIDTSETISMIKLIVNTKQPVSQGICESKISKTSGTNLYYIDLSYNSNIFMTGIDPLMFLCDLQNAGEILSIQLHQDKLPGKEKYNPELLYLKWTLFFETEKNKNDLSDIFCFVSDESDIKFIELNDCDNIELSLYQVNGNPLPYYTSSAADNKIVEVNLKEERRSADRKAAGTASDSYIRVPTEKMGIIFNTVSELLISQARLDMLAKENSDILDGNFRVVTDSLKQITQMLQEQVTSLRMMNLGSTFDRFKRVVRDIASDRGKKINLHVSGQETELDRYMIEKLNDPLIHLVRNCIDHGIEIREERLIKGKSEEGNLTISASLKGEKVILEVYDDGRGIDTEKLLNKAKLMGLVNRDKVLSELEILNLIFHPGISTAQNITDFSGRGVGMDVVRNSINELHGNIDIISEKDIGTKFKIFLPLTLAILDGILLTVGKEKYVIPTLTIMEIFRPDKSNLKSISGGEELVFFRGNYIPIIRLHQVFDIKNAQKNAEKAELIVINSSGAKAAILVDNVLEQYQIVLKSLQTNFRKVNHISSATILGDGDIALIIDIQSLLEKNKTGKNV